MNFLKVLVIASLLFIFCGSVYGVNEADSLDIQGVMLMGIQIQLLLKMLI